MSGPGSFWLKVAKAYPGGACTFTDVPQTGSAAYGVLEYLVAHKGGTQTLFTLHAYPPRAYYGAAAKTFFVVSVAVRTRYEALAGVRARLFPTGAATAGSPRASSTAITRGTPG